MAPFSKQWIVLIGKSPKGPLNESEIRELLNQKVIRTNDIAYLLPESSELKAPTEWKLLWQYPEFDRRKDAPSAVTPTERRKKEPLPSPLAELPPELVNISPEELIPRASSAAAFSDKAEEVRPSRPPLFDRLFGNRSISPTMGFAGLSVVCLGVTLWLWTSSTPLPTVVPPEPVRAPAESFVPRRSVEKAIGQMALPRMPVPVENREIERREPDNGEIPPPMEGVEEDEPLSPPGRPLRTPLKGRVGKRNPNRLLLPGSEEDQENQEAQEDALNAEAESAVGEDSEPSEE